MVKDLIVMIETPREEAGHKNRFGSSDEPADAKKSAAKPGSAFNFPKRAQLSASPFNFPITNLPNYQILGFPDSIHKGLQLP